MPDRPQAYKSVIQHQANNGNKNQLALTVNSIKDTGCMIWKYERKHQNSH
jgi:hypothetical protein